MNTFDDLFFRAREIPETAARQIFLDQACAGQPELRARLEALLADATAAENYFAEAATQAVAPPVAGANVSSKASVPSHIGPWRILERIGQGGMGEVYRAEQRQPIRREVALKLMRAGMDSSQVIARFEAERQALALMDHPHIARVLDAGADDSGHPYFVMELVRGEPITAYADRHQLSLNDRLGLMRQVCQAVQHAHAKGVIHRDLKPGNILVCTQDGRPHAKVIDFGIAKATSVSLTDKTLFTQFHQFIGTPQYMSPEQAEGSLDIDTRSDVYSLGVLLYELLTGHTPFDLARLQKIALGELARFIREVEPPKPSTRLATLEQARPETPAAPPSGAGGTLATLARSRSTAPEQLVKEVRGELDWLVMKALEKDRARRYETPSSLAEDIGRYLDGQPIHAAPPSAAYRMRKFVRKHRGPVMASAALIGLMAAGIIGTGWGLVREKAANEKAVREAELATVARREAEEQRELAETQRSRAEAERNAAQKQKAEAERQKSTADRQREAAEMEAYIGNLAAAQADMAAHDYPGARQRLAACPERLRGWEWRFLSEKAKAMLCVLPPHILPLRFTPDSTHILAFDSVANNMRLFDLEGKPSKIVFETSDENRAQPDRDDVAFSQDGKTLACVAFGKIFVFDVMTGKVLFFDANSHSKHPGSWPAGVQISPDGQIVVTSTQATIYHIDGRRTVLPVAGFKESAPLRLIASVNFQTFLTTKNNTAQLWNLAGQRIGDEVVLNDEIQHASFNSDGTRFLICTRSEVGQFDHQAKQVGASVPSKYYKASFTPDGQHIVTGADKKLLVWKTLDMSKALELSHSLEKPHPLGEFGVCDWTFSKNGRVLIAFSPYGKRSVRSWEIPSGKLVTSQIPGSGYTSFAMMDSGQRIITLGTYEGEDLNDIRNEWYSYDDLLNGGRDGDKPPLSPTDTRVVEFKRTLHGPEGLSLWDSNGQLLAATSRWRGSRENDAIVFSADEKTFFVAPDTYDARTDWAITELESGCAVCSLQNFGDPVWLNADITAPEPLEAWEPAIGHPWGRFDSRTAPTLEKYLASANQSRDLNQVSPSDIAGSIKQKRDADRLAEILTTELGLHATCVSLKLRRIFGVLNQHVIVWDVISGRELTRIRVERSPKELRSYARSKHRIELSTDGLRLIICFPDGEAQIWDSRHFDERQSYFTALDAELPEAKILARELVDSGIPSADLHRNVELINDIPKLRRILTQSLVDWELKNAEKLVWRPRIEWGIALRAKPEFIHTLYQRGILTSPRAGTLLLEKIAQEGHPDSTELLREILVLVLSRFHPEVSSLSDPFGAGGSKKTFLVPFGNSSIEAVEVAFSSLDSVTRSSPPAILCESFLNSLRNRPQKDWKDLMKNRAVASRAWAALAYLYSQTPLPDDAWASLGQLFADNNEHIVLMINHGDQTSRVYLRRSSNGRAVAEMAPAAHSRREHRLEPDVHQMVSLLVTDLLKIQDSTKVKR